MMFDGPVDPVRVAAGYTLCSCEGCLLIDLTGGFPNGATSESVVAARSWSCLVVFEASAACLQVGRSWLGHAALRYWMSWPCASLPVWRLLHGVSWGREFRSYDGVSPLIRGHRGQDP